MSKTLANFENYWHTHTPICVDGMVSAESFGTRCYLGILWCCLGNTSLLPKTIGYNIVNFDRRVSMQFVNTCKIAALKVKRRSATFLPNDCKKNTESKTLKKIHEYKPYLQ